MCYSYPKRGLLTERKIKQRIREENNLNLYRPTNIIIALSGDLYFNFYEERKRIKKHWNRYFLKRRKHIDRDTQIYSLDRPFLFLVLDY